MSYKEVLKDIKLKQTGNLYLFYGEEIYLLEETIKLMKQHVLTPDFESMNLSVIEGKSFTVNKLIDACETLPFMSDRKMVIIKDSEVFHGKKKVLSEKEEKKLIEYMRDMPEFTCLIFHEGSTIDARRKLAKEIKKNGKIVQFGKLSEGELSKWIGKRIKMQKKNINQNELVYLISQFDYFGKNAEQSMLDIRNEINKLTSYMGETVDVKKEQINDVISLKFQNDIFKLLDAISSKNLEESLKRLIYMLSEGEPVMKLMFMLSKQVKNILVVKELLDEGYSSKLIASKTKIHPFIVSKHMAQCRFFSASKLRELLSYSIKMDSSIKSGKLAERLAIELLVVEMCK
ncbi:MAG: DNA polymerase III subunit delta [Alkaliphilus sp.]